MRRCRVGQCVGALIMVLALGMTAGADVEETAMKGSAKVPMEVRYEPAWLSWVASTTGCLRALGVDCDTVDVAGYSGYAFVMTVNEGMCPSGPTVFDWGLLSSGVRSLGRSMLAFRGATCGGTPQDFQAAYEVVRREVEAGRPCVLWGTYIPEFGIAVGVEDGHYLVKTFKPMMKQPEPPIPFDELKVPGGTYVLAFPSSAAVVRSEADRAAVRHALTMIAYTSGDARYRSGLEAYDQWIAALEGGRASGQGRGHGNAYNAQCWAEAKRFAHEFLKRLAGRNEAVAEPLGRAAGAYGEAAGEMKKVADLFTLPCPEDRADDPEVRAQAIEALRAAKAAETQAVAALREAAEAWPREEPPTEQ